MALTESIDTCPPVACPSLYRSCTWTNQIKSLLLIYSISIFLILLVQINEWTTLKSGMRWYCLILRTLTFQRIASARTFLLRRRTPQSPPPTASWPEIVCGGNYPVKAWTPSRLCRSQALLMDSPLYFRWYTQPWIYKQSDTEMLMNNEKMKRCIIKLQILKISFRFNLKNLKDHSIQVTIRK